MADFIPQQDVQAISHLNVVVDDIEVATEFYCTVLGFERASNADGPMDYPSVDLASFARNAGFDDDGQLSLGVRFLKHPEVGLYLELFTGTPRATRASPAEGQTISAAFAMWRSK